MGLNSNQNSHIILHFECRYSKLKECNANTLYLEEIVHGISCRGKNNEEMGDLSAGTYTE